MKCAELELQANSKLHLKDWALDSKDNNLEFESMGTMLSLADWQADLTKITEILCLKKSSLIEPILVAVDGT